MGKKRIKKILLQAIKIGIGSSMAIYLAELFGLENAASAGSIALLTLVTTKWETVKLSIFRVVTFVFSSMMACIMFANVQSEWLVYGIFVFFVVVFCEFLGWKATISVNALIGVHFLTSRNFTPEFVLNELFLVLIGIALAVILNLFYDYKDQRKSLVKSMRYTEEKLQLILNELATYLSNMEMQRNVWEDIRSLEKELTEFIEDACEYQENTFQSHSEYYVNYFEMRMQQLGVLHNLHYEMRKIRTLPKQAKIISDYILYLIDYVHEMNVPCAQIERLEQIFADMRTEPLPVTREEFEARAMLYHILMDLEEFLVFKRRFVNSLDEKQKKRYWKKK